jgi:hypothetical protein
MHQLKALHSTPVSLEYRSGIALNQYIRRRAVDALTMHSDECCAMLAALNQETDIIALIQIKETFAQK